MFDPSIGRWTTEDPELFEAGDVNFYRFVGNGPTKMVDPLGLAGTITALAGTITVLGNATSSAEKGKLTPKGGKEFESTDDDLSESRAHYMQYDGPTEFKATYTITLKEDKSVDTSKSTIQLATVNYTSRDYVTRSSAGLTKEDEEKKIKEGKFVYRDGVYAYVFSKPSVTKSDWKSLPIAITAVTLDDKNCAVKSFKFKSGTWYPNPAKSRLIDKGLSGAVDLEAKTATFTGKYQSEKTAVIATYVVTGKIK